MTKGEAGRPGTSAGKMHGNRFYLCEAALREEPAGNPMSLCRNGSPLPQNIPLLFS